MQTLDIRILGNMQHMYCSTKDLLALQPLSVTNNSVNSRTAYSSHVDHNSSSSVHIARSGRSQTDAVISN